MFKTLQRYFVLLYHCYDSGNRQRKLAMPTSTMYTYHRWQHPWHIACPHELPMGLPQGLIMLSIHVFCHASTIRFLLLQQGAVCLSEMKNNLVVVPWWWFALWSVVTEAITYCSSYFQSTVARLYISRRKVTEQRSIVGSLLEEESVFFSWCCPRYMWLCVVSTFVNRYCCFAWVKGAPEKVHCRNVSILTFYKVFSRQQINSEVYKAKLAA